MKYCYHKVVLNNKIGVKICIFMLKIKDCTLNNTQKSDIVWHGSLLLREYGYND